MESLRARVDAIVKKQEDAESLKPWYNYLCKRPCAHDEYLQTFNRHNVHLIDTKGEGVAAITPRGAVVNGKEYELDCLVYATGFELATDWSHRSGMEIYGRNGVTVTEKWRDGASTFHGWASRNFPNCLFLGFTQAAQSRNFMYVTNGQAQHFAYIISQCQMRSIRTMEPTADAEEGWVKASVETGKARSAALRECTPGYYNNEGDFTLRAARNAAYGGGVVAFFDILRKWKGENKLEGLELTHFATENVA
jgi:cation diffusion facilitator CzcD-associated flavoprotein CzcO